MGHVEFGVDKIQAVIDAIQLIIKLSWADIKFGEDFRTKLDQFIEAKEAGVEFNANDNLDHRQPLSLTYIMALCIGARAKIILSVNSVHRVSVRCGCTSSYIFRTHLFLPSGTSCL